MYIEQNSCYGYFTKCVRLYTDYMGFSNYGTANTLAKASIPRLVQGLQQPLGLTILVGNCSGERSFSKLNVRRIRLCFVLGGNILLR